MPQNPYAKLLAKYRFSKPIPRTWITKLITEVPIEANPPRNSLDYHIFNLRSSLTLTGKIDRLSHRELISLWVLSDEPGFVAEDIRAIAHEKIVVSDWRSWCSWFGECLLQLHEIQETARHGTSPEFYFSLRGIFIHEFDACLARIIHVSLLCDNLVAS